MHGLLGRPHAHCIKKQEAEQKPHFPFFFINIKMTNKDTEKYGAEVPGRQYGVPLFTSEVHK